ncbi:unnamed protein product [Rangifer tarandus platyrhynchus]|uniref:Uncharacterized protein n=1 Tax=Rangifer tarandus platyrhynchus TaxID=3082113 RepID=A0ABN8Y9J8_RANTA|nr:unnamed protein product [Rangifer tarandus platyrhynchus]
MDDGQRATRDTELSSGCGLWAAAPACLVGVEVGTGLGKNTKLASIPSLALSSARGAGQNLREALAPARIVRAQGRRETGYGIRRSSTASLRAEAAAKRRRGHLSSISRAGVPGGAPARQLRGRLLPRPGPGGSRASRFRAAGAAWRPHREQQAVGARSGGAPGSGGRAPRARAAREQVPRAWRWQGLKLSGLPRVSLFCTCTTDMFVAAPAPAQVTWPRGRAGRKASPPESLGGTRRRQEEAGRGKASCCRCEASEGDRAGRQSREADEGDLPSVSETPEGLTSQKYRRPAGWVGGARDFNGQK